MKIQSMQDLKNEMLSVARGERKAPSELATLVKRAEPNVSRTLRKLEAQVFVRLRQGADQVKIPEIAIYRLTVDVDICAQQDKGGCPEFCVNGISSLLRHSVFELDSKPI